jgi:photosystem II stability/assembly factor-like uncharacterized protein
MKLTLIIFFLIFSGLALNAQNYKVSLLDSGKNTSIRGLSVVDNQVAWLSGSGGWVAKTVNSKDFIWQQLKGYEKIDFRDIEAFSKDEAIIVSAGSPAYILKTIDGGANWNKVYENADTAIFLDGMDFWNKKEGIIFGDPINGQMQILQTKDGGNTWENTSAKANINLANGEGGFAASGTSIRTFKNLAYIATGGLQSNLYVSKNKGKDWNKYELPIIQGQASQGCFSFAVNQKRIFITGGDYVKDQSSEKNYFYLDFYNWKWKQADTAPFGYKSSIEIIAPNQLIATGTSGTDISLDNGVSWKALTKKGFNVCKKAKKGTLILIAGGRGKVYLVSLAE